MTRGEDVGWNEWGGRDTCVAAVGTHTNALSHKLIGMSFWNDGRGGSHLEL